MGSNEITVTQHRGMQAFSRLIEQTTQNNTDTITDKPEQRDENLKIKIGTVLKFYPATDKVLVKFKDGEKERCIQSHTVISEEINISWTPAGYNQWDAKYNEACIAPLNTYHAIVLQIRNTDNNKENCVIGYISKDKQTTLPNANAGELKLQYYNTNITLMSDGIHIKGDNIFLNDKPFNLAVTEGVAENSYSHNEISELENRIKELEEKLEENTNTP